jgi:hypothetical protein
MTKSDKPHQDAIPSGSNAGPCDEPRRQTAKSVADDRSHQFAITPEEEKQIQKKIRAI